MKDHYIHPNMIEINAEISQGMAPKHAPSTSNLNYTRNRLNKI
jgi:hypothetical protein